MKRVNIYIETNKGHQKSVQRKYGYVLETQIKNELVTREGFGEMEATHHGVILHAIAESIGRIIVPSEIVIHARDDYVTARILMWKKLREMEFRDAKGKEIKNAAEWRTICEAADFHRISTICGKHEYTDWLLGQMEKKV